MKKINPFPIIFLISSLTLVSNYKVFHANIQQLTIPRMLSSGTTNKISPDYLKRISTNYPTLSSTVIPFKSILGTYWVQNDSVLKGLDLLRKGGMENPYLGFSEAMIASTFDAVGVIDSFKYYSRIAANKLPNAPQHYVLMARTYVLEKKIDSLGILYNQIKDRIRDSQLHKIYLASILENRDKLDSIQVISNAKEIKQKFPYNNDLRLLTDYIIYGEDIVVEIIKLRQESIDSFNIAPRLSIEKMKRVIELQEVNVPDYEIIIEMYFNIEDYDNVISLYNKLQLQGFTTLRAPTVERISISFVNSGNTQGGCILANDLSSYGYKLSPSLAKVCNLNQ